MIQNKSLHVDADKKTHCPCRCRTVSDYMTMYDPIKAPH